MEKVVFLDRDGTVSRDSPDHIKSWEEFHFLPHAKEAIRLLTKNGFSTIFITNQSVIARKMVTPEELEDMHRKMIHELEEAGGKVKQVYFCPHHPDEGCGCRKPQPGLLKKAISDHHITAEKAYMVGDRIMDVQAGEAVGCKTILLENERGAAELETSNSTPTYIAKNLLDAAQWIIEDYGSE